ncbi:MAG TPA: 3-deoxy-7-phosphoheptulonate synthase [Candidatus Saccharimonadales bacterium]|nr:3-deoxy-7-phosphoheptulonate synthase [Candidatus Saccharimonadales bacterium]
MVIVMRPDCTPEEVARVEARLHALGLQIFRAAGANKIVIGALGDTKSVDPRDFQVLPGVVEAHRVTEPFKLASRTFHPENTVVRAASVDIGGREVVLMAGPCTVESESQTVEAARLVAAAGARVLRGGAFKPRSSPYSFQGLGEEGLKILRRAADRVGMAVVSEVMDPGQIPMMMPYVDIFQVGARNMQNFYLLRELGKVAKPVLVKRGLSATIEEWLMSAEYVMAGGNHQVLLCERGIRTFEPYTRNTLDVSAVPVVHKLSHLPVIVDPSHAVGIRVNVPPLSLAAVAAGADGLLIEVHPDPDNALCDGAQSLFPQQFAELVQKLRLIAPAAGRTLGAPARRSAGAGRRAPRTARGRTA